MGQFGRLAVVRAYQWEKLSAYPTQSTTCFTTRFTHLESTVTSTLSATGPEILYIGFHAGQDMDKDRERMDEPEVRKLSTRRNGCSITGPREHPAAPFTLFVACMLNPFLVRVAVMLLACCSAVMMRCARVSAYYWRQGRRKHPPILPQPAPRAHPMANETHHGASCCYGVEFLRLQGSSG